MELDNIHIEGNTNAGELFNKVNQNFQKLNTAVENVKNTTVNDKGAWSTEAALKAAYPSPLVGWFATVGIEGKKYICSTKGIWSATGQVATITATQIEDSFGDSKIKTISQNFFNKTQNEYNISALNPTGGIDGTNRYTQELAETAVAQLKINFKIGDVLTFINKYGDIEKVEKTNSQKLNAVGFNALSKIFVPGRFTYWSPTTEPFVEIEDTLDVVTYEKLTIVDTFNRSIYSTETSNVSNSIKLQKDAIMLVYAAIEDNAIKLYYDIIGGDIAQATENYKKVEGLNIIPLFLYQESHILSDLLSLNSAYMNNGKSIRNEYMKLFPEKKTEHLLMLKSKFDIIGTTGNTNNVDVRLTNLLHIKHDGFYIKGNVVTDTAIPITLYIDNNSNSNRENVFTYNVGDIKGDFECMVDIADDIWKKIDFNTGYNIFLFILNSNSANIKLTVLDAYSWDYPGKDNNVILPEQFNGYGNILNVIDNTTSFGHFTVNHLMNVFPKEPHIGFSATTTNSQCNVDGILKEITATVNDGGEFTFKVGLLDQYSKFVVSQEFKVNLVSGLNNVDVSNLKIPIKKGEQISISCTENGSGNGTIVYNINEFHIDNEIIYGANNGVWSKLATDYGGELNLSYKVTQVDSIFADKNSVTALDKRIAIQQSEINKAQYIYDENGEAYTLLIRNGELKMKSMSYKKVLALGNSLTSHAHKEEIGYYGDDSWAMASTNKTNTTWTTFLQNILRSKSSAATVKPMNIFSWEVNFTDADLDEIFKDEIGVDYDLIVFRAGENSTVTDNEAFKNGFDRLITFLRNKFVTADIIITGMMWANSDRDAIFNEIADKYGLKFASLNGISNNCLLGQMLIGTDDELHPIIHNGVAAHCSDTCFFDFANLLASVLGYNEITGKHKVNIDSSLDCEINDVYQIYEGIVSIIFHSPSTPNISVKDSSGNLIEITIHDMSQVSFINTPARTITYVATFAMPDSDVTIY